MTLDEIEEFRREFGKGRMPDDPVYWKTRDVKIIKISSMETQHMINSLAMCRRNAENGDEDAKKCIPVLSRELVKRFRE